jgi:hypothetical protein
MTDYSQLTNARGEDYGPPEINHERTAKMLRAYLMAKYDIPAEIVNLIVGEDIVYFNICQKMARDMEGTDKKDTLDDIGGYVDNLLEMRGQRGGDKPSTSFKTETILVSWPDIAPREHSAFGVSPSLSNDCTISLNGGTQTLRSIRCDLNHIKVDGSNFDTTWAYRTGDTTFHEYRDNS